jgi:putative ABC transport system permease protein
MLAALGGISSLNRGSTQAVTLGRTVQTRIGFGLSNAQTEPDARMLAAMLDELEQDIHFTLRMLRANRAFTAIAVLTFAIGVGATTAIFSVVNATLLRPLPFRQPDQLMSLFLRMPVQYGSGEIDMVWSYPKYETLLRAQHAFSEVSPHVADAFTLSTPDGSDLVRGESVGARYFHILGVTPIRGRVFNDDEDRTTGGDRTIVISDALWRDRFGMSASVIGSRLEIAGNPYAIIGVAPPGFAGLSGTAQLWALYTATRGVETLKSVGTHQFEIVARLAPGVSVAAAKNAMVAAGRVIDATHPDEGPAHWRAAAYTLAELRVDPLVGKSVLVLAVAVSLLLLIACVNIASLLLARGAARRREISVRLAIGATSGRLVRQLLTESAVMAIIGVVAGLAVAVVGVRALASMAPLTAANLSTVRGNLTAISLGRIALDGPAIAFSVVVAVLAGLGAGLAPAISAGRLPLADAMREAATSTRVFGGVRRLTGRGALVAGEIALAVVLLVGSGLMIRSLSQLFGAQSGYRADHLLTARVALNATRARTEPIGQMWDEVTQRVSSIPGVVSVAVGSCAPVGDHCEGTDLDFPGRTTPAHVSFHVVTPNYFKTLGIPIQRGRDVAPTDRRETQPIMLINEVAARTIWGAADPLATELTRGDRSTRVVGIVGDVRYEDAESPAKPAVFFAAAQQSRRVAMVFVRTAGDPSALGGMLRREIRALDRNHTVTEVKTMQERMLDAASRSRFATQVMGIFAAIALGLAGIGIYGVLSIAVAQRRKEISIRMALGADRARVLRMVLTEAMSLVLAGAIVGMAGAYAGARGMASLLYGVSAADARTYVSCAIVLAAAAGLATLIPALRAMATQPASALRGE